MPPDTPILSAALRPLWRRQAALVACIFAACLIGIFSRPLGYLAAFWPANALMLGLLLRNPALGQAPTTWVASLATFVAADLLTGSTLFIALSLNLANVFGVFCAWAFLIRQGPAVLNFQRQRSVLFLFIGCLLGALGCTFVGAWPGSVAFDVPLWRSIALWLSTEFYNFILITPVFLVAPRGWFWQWQLPWRQMSMQHVLPLLALVGSEVLSLIIGGPGAIAFIMPAMVWCAMSFGIFPMTVINLVVCFWKTASIAFGAFTFTPDHVVEVTSYRTGLALLSLAPFAVACAYALRSQALTKLNYAVSHDFLTGTLSRRAFLERSQKLLTRLEEQGQCVAVLMVDIDHFKQVNDNYGHAQGDAVLQEFAVLASQTLRPEDLLGRMGGEEFAILLPRTQRDQAQIVGQRLCDLLQQHTFATSNGPLRVTLSVGLHAVTSIAPPDTMEMLLTKADEALYMAKQHGRNQVRQYGPALAPSSI